VSVPEVPIVDAKALVEFCMSAGDSSIQELVQFENPFGPDEVMVFIFMPKKVEANESGRKTAASKVRMKFRRSCVKA